MLITTPTSVGTMQHHPELWYEAMTTANIQRDTKRLLFSIVGLRTISLITAPTCPFMTAYNILNHLTAEHPELQ